MTNWRMRVRVREKMRIREREREREREGENRALRNKALTFSVEAADVGFDGLRSLRPWVLSLVKLAAKIFL